MFALDKFYVPHRKKSGDFKVDITENERTRNLELSIDEILYENAKDKLWQKQSFYYVQKFNVLVGKSVIVGIWALVMICIYVMFFRFFATNIWNFTFVTITFSSIMTFLKLLLISAVRFLICYYMIEMFYNTIRIISSMVIFMSIRVQR